MINKYYEGNEGHDTQVAGEANNSSLIPAGSQCGRKSPPALPPGLHLSRCRQAFHTQYCAQFGTQDRTKSIQARTPGHHYCLIPKSSRTLMSWHILSSRGQKQTGKLQTQSYCLLLSDWLTSLKTLSSLIDFLPYQSPRSKAIVCLSEMVCRGQGQNKGRPVPFISFLVLGPQWVPARVGVVTQPWAGSCVAPAKEEPVLESQDLSFNPGSSTYLLGLSLAWSWKN